MWAYDDARLAMRDALRLSRAMTFKNAVADLPLGGGKGVIMLPPEREISPHRRRDLLRVPSVRPAGPVELTLDAIPAEASPPLTHTNRRFTSVCVKAARPQ